MKTWSDADLLALVSVVTVIFDSADVIVDCVRVLPAAAELVVVDNASSDDGAERVLAARSGATLIRSPRNLGFGAGCNLGWRASSRPYLAFVNPDVRVDATALATLLRRLLREGGAMVGPAMLDETGSPRSCKRRPSPVSDALGLLPSSARWAPSGSDGRVASIDRVHFEGGPVAAVEGACFVMARADLALIGGFDEDFFLYYEEESLALRLGRRGGRAIYEPTARAEHVGGTSTRAIGMLATYHLHRSRAIFYRKRDGEMRGRLAVFILVLAILVAIPASSLNALLGRERQRTPRHQFHMIRGLLAGACASLHAGSPD